MKIRGTQGNWFATTPEGLLPCLKHKHHCGNQVYLDPYPYDLTVPKDAAYVAAVQQGKVVIALYDTADRRSGYQNDAIYTVEDVRLDASGLHCRITDIRR